MRKSKPKVLTLGKHGVEVSIRSKEGHYVLSILQPASEEPLALCDIAVMRQVTPGARHVSQTIMIAPGWTKVS